MVLRRYLLIGVCLGSLIAACQPESPPVSESTTSTATPTPDATIPNAPAPTITLKVPSDSPPTTPAPITVTPTPTPNPNISTPQPTTPTTPTPQPSPQIISKAGNIYQNPDLGIKFEYPPDYVVQVNQPQKSVDIWQSQDYQAFKAGKFDNSAPPGNLNITVEDNPQKLPVNEWIAQNPTFDSPGNFSPKTVAGRQAVTFRSVGLLEFEHIVIPTEDGSKMIVISHPEGEEHQQAFQRVVSTLQISRK